MDTLLNDIFHAQPDALLMIAGIVFIAIAVVGSVKTYIDPGRNGRIAAGVFGVILLVTGLVMYKPAQAAPSAPAAEAVASGSSTGTSAGTSANACYVPGKWPQLSDQQMTVGSACKNAAGDPGQAVVASQTCTYTSGPKSGTNEQFKHQMYVGYHCQSEDKQSKGSVLAPAK